MVLRLEEQRVEKKDHKLAEARALRHKERLKAARLGACRAASRSRSSRAATTSDDWRRNS